MKNIVIFESPLLLTLLISVIVLNVLCVLSRKLLKNKKIGTVIVPNIISIVTMIIHGAIFIGFFLYRIYAPDGRVVSSEEILLILLISSAITLKTSYIGSEEK